MMGNYRNNIRRRKLYRHGIDFGLNVIRVAMILVLAFNSTIARGGEIEKDIVGLPSLQNTDSVGASQTVESQSYDLVVVGGTPGGIACAVRAARQGLRVLLVNYTQHLGGFSSSGLGVADTQYDNGYTGGRVPLFGEWSQQILNHYRQTYGENSPQYKSAQAGPREIAGDRITYEARVAEKTYDGMVSREKSITLLKGYFPIAVEKAGREIKAVTLSAVTAGDTQLRVTGLIFADASYEGDLSALAGVPYRVGRESRDEYGEPHAGRIFTATGFSTGGKGAYPNEAVTGKLNLRPFQAVTQQIFAGSTGEGDHKVQSYQIRLCLSRDPNNRRFPEKPKNYDPKAFSYVIERYGYGIGGNDIPNQKANWNRNLPGASYEYPDADWSERQAIHARHRDFAVGFLWFLQNDSSVPEESRTKARDWGLCKDEFIDNDNIPYEMYVREARRIVGRYVFNEHDASLAPGFNRTPVHTDSIAIAEWFMDSHEVSTEKMPGSDAEGKILLTEITRPSQIPYRSMLPKELDNLLVPVALSATHVAWGTIRLEPTWMHIGESAAFAAALALKQKTLPGLLSVSRLQRELVENGVMLSFFNDFDMKTEKPWVAAVQYLATKGFFADYNARPDEPLTTFTAREWAQTFGESASGKSDANARARAIAQINNNVGSGESVTVAQYAALLSNALEYWNVKTDADAAKIADRLKLKSNAVITRGEACRLTHETLKQIEK